MSQDRTGIALDRAVRFVLFPLSVMFAVAALVLAIKTYKDLEETSISSAFATVQSVDEAYTLDSAYPSSVVLSSADRHFEHFWVVSTDGEVLATNDAVSAGRDIAPDIRTAMDEAGDGRFLLEYRNGGARSVVVGALSSEATYWSIVELSPPFNFTTAVWLILAVLALSLMSVSGLIALRYLRTRPRSLLLSSRSEDRSAPLDSSKRDLSRWEVRSDGSPDFVVDDPTASATDLHEAVLKAKDDFVIVLDAAGSVVYSNPPVHLSDTERLAGIDGLTAFSDRFLDERGRARFDDWLRSRSEARVLVLDVCGPDGRMQTTRWTGHLMEMRSGATFRIFVGQAMLIEEFPEPTP